MLLLFFLSALAFLQDAKVISLTTTLLTTPVLSLERDKKCFTALIFARTPQNPERKKHAECIRNKKISLFRSLVCVCVYLLSLDFERVATLSAAAIITELESSSYFALATAAISIGA